MTASFRASSGVDSRSISQDSIACLSSAVIGAIFCGSISVASGSTSLANNVGETQQAISSTQVQDCWRFGLIIDLKWIGRRKSEGASDTNTRRPRTPDRIGSDVRVSAEPSVTQQTRGCTTARIVRDGPNSDLLNTALRTAATEQRPQSSLHERCDRPQHRHAGRIRPDG